MQANPDNRFHAAAFAGALEGLGHAHRDAEQPEQAADNYRRSIERAERIIAEFPDDAYGPSTVIVCGRELGRVLMDMAASAPRAEARECRVEALNCLARSLELLDEMSARGAQPNHGDVEHSALLAALEECERALAL